MENLSLKDDDYGDIFITQECNNNDGSVDKLCEEMEVDDSVFLGVNPEDMQSPCMSLVKPKYEGVAYYSDISDWEEEGNQMNFKKECR